VTTPGGQGDVDYLAKLGVKSKKDKKKLAKLAKKAKRAAKKAKPDL
jgi:hypothetical protein